MTTNKQELYFNFDGVNSREFGLIAVNFNSGLYEETLGPSRTINETETVKRDTTIFHGINEDNRSIELNLAFEDDFDEDKINDIINWLFKDYYRPLYFENQRDRVMFSMISGDSTIIHNGLNQGYFTVTLQTNSPYRYSRMWTGSNEGSNEMELINDGHKIVYPELSIDKVGDGDLTIEVNGRSVLIVNLTDGESLFIDTMRGKIVTDIIGEYRYNNIRAGELEDLYLDKGHNTYTINGDANI